MANACDNYNPDHNGECMTCDEPLFEHGDEIAVLRRQIANGATHDCGQWLSSDGRCELCDRTVQDRREDHAKAKEQGESKG